MKPTRLRKANLREDRRNLQKWHHCLDGRPSRGRKSSDARPSHWWVFVSAMRVKQEVFPEFTLDVVGISIPYPGASPEEVETGILLSVEDSVRSIEGVKKVTSTAGEGRGSVSVELLTSADIDRALQEVKNAVDRIRTFPEDAERPTVSLIENRNRVLTLAAIGPLQRTNTAQHRRAYTR